MGAGETVRALDLWHAAINGRGRFYAVTKGEDLEKAFREIFGQINTETENELMATAASGSNSSRNDVAKFTASYEPKNLWKGSVVSELVKTDGSTVANPGWGGKNTADKLDDLANVTNRLILSWGDKWLGLAGQPYQGGVPFKWIAGDTNLSTLQKTMLGTVPGITGYTVASSGENILNYVRGDRSLEGSEATGYTTAKPFRERKSRQGDIVNSQVWYTGAPSSNYALKGYSAFTRAYKSRTPMIYVGGNDGMLHGFSATDGSEKLAYVPRGVIPSLKKITEPAFNSTHKYFVDGSPMTGDVDMGVGIQAPDDPGYTDTYAPNWRTLLVGTLGAGGKGYFVLDVTDPSGTINATDSFAESNAQNRVLIDRTRGSSETVSCATLTGAEKLACDQAVLEGQDIGSITAQPVLDDNNPMRTTQITRMNNNRWAAVLGNGYNSTNQRPVLLVQYLDGAKELLRIPTVGTAAVAPTPGTGIANDNGLAAPRLMDINGDGRPDVAYAGDNLGNMWKFDLTSITDTQWKVAFSGHPLFTATGPASLSSTARNKVQPITIPPTVRANDRTKTVGTPPITLPVGGVMVAFGTGRNLTTDDAANVDVQTLYSVLDNTRYRTVTTALGKRLEVHPGGGTCPNGTDCVPAPAYLGTGVVTAKLAQQKITELASGDLGTVDAVTALNKSTWDNYNGWYMDFPSVGERQLKPFEFYDGSNILAVYSQVPAKGSDVDPNVETCESNTVDEERQYRTFINVMDGARPSIQIVDANSDGAFNSADNGVSRKRVRKGSHRLISKNKTTMLDVDVKNDKENLARMPERSLRPSWRQMK
jgi:type IV pilus assembly protein PilY1